MPADEFLSFPPDTLGREPLRIPIVARGEAWIALGKPAGVPWRPDPWIPRPTDLVREVGRQIQAGKPQLQRLGIDDLIGVTGPDLVASGLVLCARTETEAARLANALGSGQIELAYQLLSTGTPLHHEFDCDLPLAPHATAPRMIVSHATGKKTSTHFRLEQRFRGCALWTATTTYDRMHQLRVHAAESGLPILGEARYAKSRPVYLSDLKRDYRPGAGRERPLYGELCLHLTRITLPTADGGRRVLAWSPPKGFAVLLRRLEEHVPDRRSGGMNPPEGTGPRSAATSA